VHSICVVPLARVSRVATNPHRKPWTSSVVLVRTKDSNEFDWRVIELFEKTGNVIAGSDPFWEQPDAHVGASSVQKRHIANAVDNRRHRQGHVCLRADSTPESFGQHCFKPLTAALGRQVQVRNVAVLQVLCLQVSDWKQDSRTISTPATFDTGTSITPI
jgi:hypothetical protein